jgi:hypothetical protein
MRIIFMFLMSFWVGIIPITLAQSSPQWRDGQQTNKRTYSPDPKENKVTPLILTSFVKNGHEQQADNPDAKTKEENKWPWEELRAWTTLVFTFILVVFTGLTWWTYRHILTTTRAIERAYIKMSHTGDFVLDPSQGKGWISMKVENFGNTPARVTCHLLTQPLLPKGQELPDAPNYGNGRQIPVEAFLVKMDFFTFIHEIPISAAEIVNMMGSCPTISLHLIGYVDYIDKFRDRHRAGYARQYDPINKQFVFVDKTEYNYDRPRKKNESHDWEQKPQANYALHRIAAVLRLIRIRSRQIGGSR